LQRFPRLARSFRGELDLISLSPSLSRSVERCHFFLRVDNKVGRLVRLASRLDRIAR
jgi:hypothetical protein